MSDCTPYMLLMFLLGVSFGMKLVSLFFRGQISREGKKWEEIIDTYKETVAAQTRAINSQRETIDLLGGELKSRGIFK